MAENYEKLDEKISEGLDSLNSSDQDYCDRVKAVRDLYELKIKEEQTQNEYYVKAQEVDNRSEELDIRKTELEQERAQEEKESHWWNKLNPNSIISVAVMGGLSLLAMKKETEGYIIKPDSFLGKLLKIER